MITLIILVQNPKGGGLVSSFSSSNQFMGVRKTSDFLEKATWTLAIALLVLSLSSIFVIPRETNANKADTELKEFKNLAPIEQPPQTFPVQKETQSPEK